MPFFGSQQLQLVSISFSLLVGVWGLERVNDAAYSKTLGIQVLQIGLHHPNQREERKLRESLQNYILRGRWEVARSRKLDLRILNSPHPSMSPAMSMSEEKRRAGRDILAAIIDKDLIAGVSLTCRLHIRYQEPGGGRRAEGRRVETIVWPRKAPFVLNTKKVPVIYHLTRDHSLRRYVLCLQ